MRIVIDIPEAEFKALQIVEKRRLGIGTLERAVLDGTPLLNSYERKFESMVVEYPPEDLCTYPEYKGKPYFSIQYEENGEHFIGFGTYNPEVLSRYLIEYFITPTIIEADKEE